MLVTLLQLVTRIHKYYSFTVVNDTIHHNNTSYLPHSKALSADAGLVLVSFLGAYLQARRTQAKEGPAKREHNEMICNSGF